MRSRIVLAAADGLGNTAIAHELAVGSARKWRSRFLADRLDGLLDEPRPGRPRTVSDEHVEAVITATLETAPKDATHWSTRSLAAQLGMSQSAVSRIWRAFGLQPHRQEAWKLGHHAPLTVADHLHRNGKQIAQPVHCAIGPVLLHEGEQAVEEHHDDDRHGQLGHSGEGGKRRGRPQ